MPGAVQGGYQGLGAGQVMYGKLFASMYEGTLYGQWQAIVTLQQMVILADDEGVIDLTPPALAARTSIPIEVIAKGIADLSEADKYSRSDLHEGRRIVPIDPGRPWGWRIVNYRYYRDLASREDKKRKDRERLADKRREVSQDVAKCREPSHKVADVAYTDTDTDTDKKKNGRSATLFPSFWEAYPKKRKKQEALKVWKAKALDSKADSIIADVNARRRRDERWLAGFVPDPTTYLRGERWEDEMQDRGDTRTQEQRDADLAELQRCLDG